MLCPIFLLERLDKHSSRFTRKTTRVHLVITNLNTIEFTAFLVGATVSLDSSKHTSSTQVLLGLGTKSSAPNRNYSGILTLTSRPNKNRKSKKCNFLSAANKWSKSVRCIEQTLLLFKNKTLIYRFTRITKYQHFKGSYRSVLQH